MATASFRLGRTASAFRTPLGQVISAVEIGWAVAVWMTVALLLLRCAVQPRPSY